MGHSGPTPKARSEKAIAAHLRCGKKLRYPEMSLLCVCWGGGHVQLL